MYAYSYFVSIPAQTSHKKMQIYEVQCFGKMSSKMILN